MAVSNSFSMTRRRFPTWVRAIGIVGAVCLLVVLVWAVLVAATYGAAWLRLGPNFTTPTAGMPVGTQTPQSPEGAHTILVAVPGRDGTLEAPPALVQFGEVRARPAVVVIPSALTIVAVGDARHDIADVYANGGLVGLRQAVIDYSEVAIDDVVAVSPRAVAELIDTIGAVELCEPQCATLDGTGFLAAFGVLSENERLTYLATVLGAAADTVDRSYVLRHPRRSWRLVAQLPDALTTTHALRGAALLRVLAAVRETPPVQWVTMPLLRTADGTVLAAPEPAMLQFAALRDGTTFDDSDTVSVDDLRQEVRDEVSVAVANAAGIQGLAAEIAGRLASDGFQIVASGNANRFDAQATEIRFQRDDPRAEFIAEELAEQLGALLRPQTDAVTFEQQPVDVLVLLGAEARS